MTTENIIDSVEMENADFESMMGGLVVLPAVAVGAVIVVGFAHIKNTIKNVFSSDKNF